MGDSDPPRGNVSDDLPGLDGQSLRELLSDWTDAEWAEWFRDEVMGHDGWSWVADRLSEADARDQ
jgi:hypothetical protein